MKNFNEVNAGRGPYIKHPRKEVSIAANISAEMWLFFSIQLNQDDWNDYTSIEAKYAKMERKIYGPKNNFRTCYNRARNIRDGKIGSSSASGFGKFIRQIEEA